MKPKKKTNSHWHWIQINEKNGSNLNFNFILLPSSATNKSWVGQLSSSVLFIFGKWCSICCSNRFNFFVNGKFICLMQVSIMFRSSAMTPPNFCTSTSDGNLRVDQRCPSHCPSLLHPPPNTHTFLYIYKWWKSWSRPEKFPSHCLRLITQIPPFPSNFFFYFHSTRDGNPSTDQRKALATVWGF